MVFRATDSLDSMYIYNATAITDCVDCYNISHVIYVMSVSIHYKIDSMECRDSYFCIIAVIAQIV